MKLGLIPFDPVILPPDLMLALRHPQYLLAAGEARVVQDARQQ